MRLIDAIILSKITSYSDDPIASYPMRKISKGGSEPQTFYTVYLKGVDIFMSLVISRQRSRFVSLSLQWASSFSPYGGQNTMRSYSDLVVNVIIAPLGCED